MTTADPLAQKVLQHLAATRGPDDPIGSLARTVLAGPTPLREALTWSWHREGLATAFAAAQREQDRMTPAERAAYADQAARITES